MPPEPATDATAFGTEPVRVDRYAPVSHPAVGMKVRDGGGLDVKIRTRPVLEVDRAGIAGTAEAWVRHELDATERTPGPDWIRVEKWRRQVHLDVDGAICPTDDPAAARDGLSLEVTDLAVGEHRDEAWTVAAEAWGRAGDVATIVTALERHLPLTVGARLLRADLCASYPAWIAAHDGDGDGG